MIQSPSIKLIFVSNVCSCTYACTNSHAARKNGQKIPPLGDGRCVELVMLLRLDWGVLLGETEARGEGSAWKDPEVVLGEGSAWKDPEGVRGESDPPRGVKDALGKRPAGGSCVRGDKDDLLLFRVLAAVRCWLAVFRIDAGVGNRRGLLGAGHGLWSASLSLEWGLGTLHVSGTCKCQSLCLVHVYIHVCNLFLP